jgi:hypothetical protein
MNIERIPFYVWNGWNSKDWYSECADCIVDLFGADNLVLVAKCLAATSMNNYLKGNVRQARKALYQIKNNIPFKGIGFKNVRVALQATLDQKDFSGRKTNNFWKAMTGDKDAVVVDIWILRAFGFPNTTPTKKQYDNIESWIMNEAAARNLEARQLQAMIWIGARTHFKGPDVSTYATLLNHHCKNLFGVI